MLRQIVSKVQREIIVEKDLLANSRQAWQTKLMKCQQEIEVLCEEVALTTAVLNTVDALVVVFDAEGYIVRCNCAWEQTTGYKFDQVRNQPFWELFFTLQEKETVKATFEKIQVRKLALVHENEWITKDGRRRRIVWSYTPFFDANGTVKYAIATGKDITATNCLAAERQRAEEALHRLEVTPAVQLTRLAEEAKQAAFAKEQEKAAQERAAELDRMNKALQTEVRERQRAEQVSRGQTETLVRTLTVLAAEPVLDNFLGYVLQAIAEQLGDCSGGIYLYSKEQDTTILHINYENGQIQRGVQITHPGASTLNPPRQWDAEYMPLLRQQQILIHNERDFATSTAYAPYRNNNAERGIKTILVVPLLFGDTFLGNITLRSTRRRDYKPEELELARVLAYQATLALKLTRLADRAQQSAVLEERNRIAREIHDTLAQTLTGIVVQLQAAEDVHTTDFNDRQAHIAAARLLAKEGLTEARRSVRALRPQALEDTDLVGALVNLIEQMATGNGIQTICHVRGTSYFLPPVVESNLLRIGQEAFTNTLKHSHASEVQIELVYMPGQVQLRVQDNGQGFDPDLRLTKGYGLLSMRERSQKIGAELTITSKPGAGTEVAIAVPVFSLSS